MVIKYYLIIVPFLMCSFLASGIIVYIPWNYLKSMGMILMGNSIYTRFKILHFLGWVFIGPFVLVYYNFKDMMILLKVINKNFSIYSPQDKILNKVSDINIIYIKRYESLKNGIANMVSENPERKNIPYMELLSYLMNGGKFAGIRMEHMMGRTGKREKKSPMAKLRDLIRKHFKKGGGQSKWIKNIYAAKRKFYIEILDSFQNYKSYNMKKEDAFIEADIVLEMLENINRSNIVYLRARQIFAI